MITGNQIVPLEKTEQQKMFDYLEELSFNAAIDEVGNIKESG
ncbi:hypothetical protein [Bacillus sp. FJAT-44742]|nr:hypothetical protein [Bacillus sp. FJAT-44742]